jgi:hypothetical protein
MREAFNANHSIIHQVKFDLLPLHFACALKPGRNFPESRAVATFQPFNPSTFQQFNPLTRNPQPFNPQPINP